MNTIFSTLQLICVFHYLSTFSVTSLKVLCLFLLYFVVTKFCLKDFEREVWGQINIIKVRKDKTLLFFQRVLLGKKPCPWVYLLHMLSYLCRDLWIVFTFCGFFLIQEKQEEERRKKISRYFTSSIKSVANYCLRFKALHLTGNSLRQTNISALGAFKILFMLPFL